MQTVLAGVYAERDSLAAQLEALRNGGDAGERNTAVGEARGEVAPAVGFDAGGNSVWQPRSGRLPVRLPIVYCVVLQTVICSPQIHSWSQLLGSATAARALYCATACRACTAIHVVQIHYPYIGSSTRFLDGVCAPGFTLFMRNAWGVWDIH